MPAAPPPRRDTAWRILGAVLLTLLTLGLALIYPLVMKGSAWLHVDWQYAWAALLLLVVPVLWWWGTFGQDPRRTRLLIGTAVPLRRAPRGWRVRFRDLPGILRAAAVWAVRISE